MQRITTVVLLCALAVMALSITTSCKSVISGGSSGAPPKEPGHYLKAGGSFQKISDDRMIGSIAYEVTLEEFTQKAIPIPTSCTTIEYGCRLTPTQARDALSGGFLAQHHFSDIRLCPATTRPAYQDRAVRVDAKVDAGYPWVHASDAEDRSQYKDGDTYILLTFTLPASPEGKYFLYQYGSGWIALQRKK